MTDVLDGVMDCIFGAVLAPHIEKIAHAFGVPLSPNVVIVRPNAYEFRITVDGLMASLRLSVKDNGPHPDNDGSRCTTITPSIVSYIPMDSETVERIKTCLEDWDFTAVSRACDEIAALYIDTIMNPVKAD